MGGAAPAVLNAANEVAVEAFLQRGLPFTRIAPTIEKVLAGYQPGAPSDIEDILEIDRIARERTVAALAVTA